MSRCVCLTVAAALLLSAAPARAQDAMPKLTISSTLPLYVGLPIERDLPDDARHKLLLGANWNVYFGGNLGLGVDADFLTGGDAGLKMFGAFTLMYHLFDVWEGDRSGMFDPFFGIGMGWTDGPGYYDTSGPFPLYVATIDFTVAMQVGVNYWLAERIGLIVKTKFFLNRITDFFQITAGLNIALFNWTLGPAPE